MSQQKLAINQIQETLDRKNKELTALSLKLLQKERQLSEFKQKLKTTNRVVNLNELNQMVKSISVSNTLNWKEFEAHFLELNDDFFNLDESAFESDMWLTPRTFAEVFGME